MRSGAGGGARLTETKNACEYKITPIASYDLWLAGDERMNGNGYIPDEELLSKTGDYKTHHPKTSSTAITKQAKKLIEKHPGYLVGLVTGVLGALAKYLGADGLESIGDGLITSGVVFIGSQVIYDLTKKTEEKYESKRLRIYKEIRDLLREAVKTPTDGRLDEKINYKGELERLVKGMNRTDRKVDEEYIKKLENTLKILRSQLEMLRV